MFLHNLTSPDPRYRDLDFHPGLNILVADRTTLPSCTRNRSGAGKSSLLHLLHFMFAGEQPESLQRSVLDNFPLSLHLEWQVDGEPARFSVIRELGNQKVELDGGPEVVTDRAMDVEAWSSWQHRVLFGAGEQRTGVTVAQLWGQLLRQEFRKDIGTVPAACSFRGSRMGYLLGLDTAALVEAADVAHEVRMRRRMTDVALLDAVPGLPVDQATLRARLADVRQQRDSVQRQLAGFRVGQQYETHLDEADALSGQIEQLNTRRQVTKERLRRLRAVLSHAEQAADQGQLEAELHDTAELVARLKRAYEDQRVMLPDVALRRFDDVQEFHQSLLRNRKQHLAEEAIHLQEQLDDDKHAVAAADTRRAEVLQLLSASTALDTFVESQRALIELQQQAKSLEKQLVLAEQADAESTELEVRLIRAQQQVSLAISTCKTLQGAMSQYAELVRGISRDRTGDLIVRTGCDGAIEVLPTIEGDFSPGIGGVRIFALDTAILISALRCGRAPGLLVHDSDLFDAMDDRRVARCLEAGATLAAKHDYQYVVTINSDKLTQVARETTMDLHSHILEPRLTDATDEGGLFGFRFE